MATSVTGASDAQFMTAVHPKISGGSAPLVITSMRSDNVEHDLSSSLWWQRALRRIDDGVMSASRQMVGNRGALIVLMFHGLFKDEAEAFSGDVDPYQPLTGDDLATLIACFQNAGYKFISPADLEAPLQSSDKRVLLTFDDGYANNLRALPIMQRFNVPATFFVASGNVASGEPFWWDVLYRERHLRNTPKPQMVAERQKLKSLNNSEIKAHLRSLFGSDAFTARSDADRPMTVDNLKTLASDPLATVGNHSVDHGYAMIGGPTLLRHCQVVMAPFSMSGIKHAILSRRQQAALP